MFSPSGYLSQGYTDAEVGPSDADRFLSWSMLEGLIDVGLRVCECANQTYDVPGVCELSRSALKLKIVCFDEIWFSSVHFWCNPSSILMKADDMVQLGRERS